MRRRSRTRGRTGSRSRAVPTAAPYSIDDNLWADRPRAGVEDLAKAPADDVFQLVTRPRDAPDEPQRIRVAFERGVPVSLDGERAHLADLIDRAAEIGCRHGVGIVDHIEDRIVGLKVRDLYEVPAAAILLTAHQDLEKLVSTIHQNEHKHALERRWAYLVYAGLWLDPLRRDLDAYMDSANERVTGEITLELYKGSVRVVERRSPYALYDAVARELRRVGGRVLTRSEPGLHRAVHSAEPDGAPDWRAPEGERRGRMTAIMK